MDHLATKYHEFPSLGFGITHAHSFSFTSTTVFNGSTLRRKALFIKHSGLALKSSRVMRHTKEMPLEGSLLPKQSTIFTISVWRNGKAETATGCFQKQETRVVRHPACHATQYGPTSDCFVILRCSRPEACGPCVRVHAPTPEGLQPDASAQNLGLWCTFETEVEDTVIYLQEVTGSRQTQMRKHKL